MGLFHPEFWQRHACLSQKPQDAGQGKSDGPQCAFAQGLGPLRQDLVQPASPQGPPEEGPCSQGRRRCPSPPQDPEASCEEPKPSNTTSRLASVVVSLWLSSRTPACQRRRPSLLASVLTC